MSATRYFPTPSDRMGFLWTLTSIEDCYVIEFGPAGTTHFAVEGVMELNAEHRMNVYTTHLSEVDITFGRYDKLAGAVREIDAAHRPGYIFVMASSVSALIGVDIESICLELQDGVEARLIPAPYGGYDGDYNLGVERALLALAQYVMKDCRPRERIYNLVGCNIDACHFESDRTEIETMMEKVFGLKRNACLTAYTSIEEIEKAPQAQFNLVIRAEGIKTAEFMKQKWGIPYVYGRPYGLSGTLSWLYGVAEEFGLAPDMDYLTGQAEEIRKYLGQYKRMLRRASCRDAVIYGDFDTAWGISGLLEELGLSVRSVFVKHAPTGEKPEEERVVFKPPEDRLKDSVSGEYYAAFGDDTLRQLCGGKRFFQIANPDMDRYRFYPLTPLVGFHGALYLLQELMNREREKG